MRNPLLLCLLLELTACGDTPPERDACAGPKGSITDLSAEPAYTATYLHRWSVDGCPVRLDVLMNRDGGCGPEDLIMGTPLGSVSGGASARIFVRGDTTGLGGGAKGFQADAALPAAATDTGFRQGTAELWMLPNDDTFVFIRHLDEQRVEAWPRDPSPITCL